MSNSLREALSDATAVLEEILDAFSRGEGGVYKSDVAEAIDNARAALAEPARVYNSARDALEKIRDYILTGKAGDGCMAPIVNWCDAALAAPPRNCEVGTPEEQAKRFDSFCVSHYTPPNKDGVVPDGCNCPCYTRGKGCNPFAWGQLPYVEKEGGAE